MWDLINILIQHIYGKINKKYASYFKSRKNYYVSSIVTRKSYFVCMNVMKSTSYGKLILCVIKLPKDPKLYLSIYFTTNQILLENQAPKIIGNTNPQQPVKTPTSVIKRWASN